MAYPSVESTEEGRQKLRDVVDAVGQYGGIMQASTALGMGESSVRRYYRRAEQLGYLGDKEPEVELPTFPDDDLPVVELKNHMIRRHEKRLEHQKALKWFSIKVNNDKPIGICWFGDPHVDNNGCNWPLLDEHIDICKATDGLYGANIGDTTDNWIGRLVRLYAHSDQSKETARKLAKWFLCDSGVDWLLWLHGNHDLWGDFAPFIREASIATIPMVDWQARFTLDFKGGRQARVWAAHDFPGHSMWNSLHGPQKAAHMKSPAHLYVCGHKHNWALHQEESASKEFTYWLARARGYKFIDDHAEFLGHDSQRFGASVVTVIDPKASEAGFIQCFADVGQGAEYLTWLRSR